MIGYRSVQEFGEIRKKKANLTMKRHFLVEDYLQAKGLEFSKNFHYQAFLNLSESIDLHNINPKNKTHAL